MNDSSITLTPNERDLVVRLLDRELADTRSEFRRTDSSPEFREDVGREEKARRETVAGVARQIAIAGRLRSDVS
jgi:hypothetical protein